MKFCDKCFEKINDSYVRATVGSECFEFCDIECFQEFATLNDLDECTLEFVVLGDDKYENANNGSSTKDK